MSRSRALLLVAALSGCAEAQPFVREGDQKSVDIVYSGDLASAQQLARKHCGQFERTPRLVYRTTDNALFDCITPPRGP